MTNLFDYFHFNLLRSMSAAPRTCHSTRTIIHLPKNKSEEMGNANYNPIKLLKFSM